MPKRKGGGNIDPRENVELIETPEYRAFVDKFKHKKTTDDCYTPPAVYEAIKGWACREYGIDPCDRIPVAPAAHICRLRRETPRVFARISQVSPERSRRERTSSASVFRLSCLGAEPSSI